MARPRGQVEDFQDYASGRKKSYFSHSKDNDDQKDIALFQHLGARETIDELMQGVPQEVKMVGILFKEEKIMGSNARTKAMLKALRSFLSTTQCRDPIQIHKMLKHYIQYLERCRVFSPGMDTAREFIQKTQEDNFSYDMMPDRTDEKVALALQRICEEIDNFIDFKIDLACKTIGVVGAEKIQENDVILTYAHSQAVESVIRTAHSEGKQFQVIVVDGRPLFEGRNLMNMLLDLGIKTTYLLVSAVPYVMSDVNKVFIGGSGLLKNGSLINRTGTGQVCCIAHNFKVPVLAWVEAYKFCEQVWIDSICYNELGAADKLTNTQMYEGDVQIPHKLGKDQRRLNVCNLKYDVTPGEYLDMVITEAGSIPVTSVPVILREYMKEELI